MPSPIVDAVLPLRIDPAPARVVRVFVGRLELATEATLTDIRTTARTNDQASQQKYGRFLRPFIERLLAQRQSPSDRARVEAMLVAASGGSEPSPPACL